MTPAMLNSLPLAAKPVGLGVAAAVPDVPSVPDAPAGGCGAGSGLLLPSWTSLARIHTRRVSAHGSLA